MMNTIVRLVNPTNGNEAHKHMEQGAYWIEVYRDDKLIARFLSGDQEPTK